MGSNVIVTIIVIVYLLFMLWIGWYSSTKISCLLYTSPSPRDTR